MTRRLVALALLAALAAACTSSEALPRSFGATGPTGTTETSPSPAPDVGLPAPDEEIPLQGSALARVLEETFASNRSAIEAWVEQGDQASLGSGGGYVFA